MLSELKALEYLKEFKELQTKYGLTHSAPKTVIMGLSIHGLFTQETRTKLLNACGRGSYSFSTQWMNLEHYHTELLNASSNQLKISFKKS